LKSRPMFPRPNIPRNHFTACTKDCK
jgi:hypothetical protein